MSDSGESRGSERGQQSIIGRISWAEGVVIGGPSVSMDCFSFPPATTTRMKRMNNASCGQRGLTFSDGVLARQRR